MMLLLSMFPVLTFLYVVDHLKGKKNIHLIVKGVSSKLSGKYIHSCTNFFGFLVKDFKLWLLAYFEISLNCANFQKDLEKLDMRQFIRVPPLDLPVQ